MKCEHDEYIFRIESVSICCQEEGYIRFCIPQNVEGCRHPMPDGFPGKIQTRAKVLLSSLPGPRRDVFPDVPFLHSASDFFSNFLASAGAAM